MPWTWLAWDSHCDMVHLDKQVNGAIQCDVCSSPPGSMNVHKASPGTTYSQARRLVSTSLTQPHTAAMTDYLVGGILLLYTTETDYNTGLLGGAGGGTLTACACCLLLCLSFVSIRLLRSRR